MNNDELVQAIKEELGAQAHNEAYHSLRDFIFQKLRKKVEDEGLLEDLFHEGYLKLRMMLLFRGLVCRNAKAYLLIIIRNLWLSHLRKRNRGPRPGRKSLEEIFVDVLNADPNVEDPDDEDAIEWPDDASGEPAPSDHPMPDGDLAMASELRRKLLVAVATLKAPNAEMVLKYFLSDPPIALKDVKIQVKSPETGYRNYENLKKLKQRTIKMLCKILKNNNH